MTTTRTINQGDIFWITPTKNQQQELGEHSHPYVVVQENLFNHSRIHSVVVCALTTNMRHANYPGNVRLDLGEGNLEKQSVVAVSKISAVDKADLGEYIGTLSPERVEQILAGIRFLQSSFIR